MKRGPKANLPSEKLARGTFQPCRDAGTVELVEPHALPLEPDWITPAGREVWLDNIGRVSTSKGATELDSDMFANFCNLQGAITAAWRAGEVPPAAHLMESRKMAEQFRIFGPASRLTKVGEGGKPTGNPFARNGRRG